MGSDEGKRIVAAAIRLKDGTVFSAPAPGRHCDVFLLMSTMNLKPGEAAGAEQGFLDSTGQFVTREKAYDVAHAAGQILDFEKVRPGYLFSEDVW